ncbi:MAG: DUF3341 domain-containing protein [Opitutales bacterium]
MAAVTSETGETYGVIGTFDTTSAIYHACEKTRDAGWKRWDSYTPFPVHGLDKASGMKRSKVPIFTFIGGVSGFTLGNLMVWFMNEFDYPLVVGGKPFYSPIFPFPITYELTILLAAFGTLLGMFLLNLLPQHYSPLWNYEGFNAVTDDKFMICLESGDPQFDESGAIRFLEELGASDITVIKD